MIILPIKIIKWLLIWNIFFSRKTKEQEEDDNSIPKLNVKLNWSIGNKFNKLSLSITKPFKNKRFVSVNY